MHLCWTKQRQLLRPWLSVSGTYNEATVSHNRGAVVQWLARPLVMPAAGVRSPDQALTFLGVETWLSTLEIVFICVFRMRHKKLLVPSIRCLCQGK